MARTDGIVNQPHSSGSQPDISALRRRWRIHPRAQHNFSDSRQSRSHVIAMIDAVTPSSSLKPGRPDARTCQASVGATPHRPMEEFPTSAWLNPRDWCHSNTRRRFLPGDEIWKTRNLTGPDASRRSVRLRRKFCKIPQSIAPDCDPDLTGQALSVASAPTGRRNRQHCDRLCAWAGLGSCTEQVTMAAVLGLSAGFCPAPRPRNAIARTSVGWTSELTHFALWAMQPQSWPQYRQAALFCPGDCLRRSRHRGRDLLRCQGADHALR